MESEEPVRKLGYARVSTSDQNLDMQIEALKRYGVPEGLIFTDKLSGGTTRRPGLVRAIQLAQMPGTEFVVWKLDRLGRSIRHLIDIVNDDLAAHGIGFKSLTEGLDTTTPGGRFIFHIFAALAEFERDLIRERTMAGLAAARAAGRHGGRPPRMNARKIAVARQMFAATDEHGRRLHTVQEIAETVGVSRTTVYRYLDRTPT